MNIPIAHSSESLERFTDHIKNAEIPLAVTAEYLRKNGFTSHNDRELRQIFKLLGFIDSKDRPTNKWLQYKTLQDETLARAIRECYSSLYELYPESPWNRSDEALRVWFRPPLTSESKSSIERAIRTYRKLCKIAGMEAPSPLKQENAQAILPETVTFQRTTQSQVVLQLPILQSREAYMEIFEALKQTFYT